MKIRVIMPELKCPICGKWFIPAACHAYKSKCKPSGKKVCSWHCVLESERRRGAAKNKKGESK